MSPRIYAGSSLSVSMTDGQSGELCASYGAVKSACVVRATARDGHRLNVIFITILELGSRC